MKPLVAQLLSTFEVGGAERLALQLSQALHARAWRCMAIALLKSGPMQPRFEEAGLPCRVLGRSIPRGLDPFAVIRLARLLRKERVAVLHCHNRLAQIYGGFAARLAGTPAVICSRHAAAVNGRLLPPQVLERASARCIHQFVAVSEDVMRQATELGRLPADRSRVIYNGVDTNSFTPLSEWAEGPPAIIMVARLDPLKRHDLLLRAARRLRDEGLDLRVRIVGDGPARSDIARLVNNLGLDDIVELPGHREDVADLLRSSHLFALPSDSEGLPMTIIEAMACGLPVVATRVGGIPELIEPERNGFLIEAGDEAALAERLRRLIIDKELLERMSVEARRIAISRFEIDVAAEAHTAMYTQVLNDRGIRVSGTE